MMQEFLDTADKLLADSFGAVPAHSLQTGHGFLFTDGIRAVQAIQAAQDRKLRNSAHRWHNILKSHDWMRDW
jgi:hypothetical protein